LALLALADEQTKPPKDNQRGIETNAKAEKESLVKQHCHIENYIFSDAGILSRSVFGALGST
jgi:hypothetical protein